MIVGAGRNIDQAKAPIYYTIGDTTIAYLAASRVIFAMDWYATQTRPGMIGTYDPTLLLSSIEEAKKNSDYVVVYVHWGVERNHYPEDYQKNFAKNILMLGQTLSLVVTLMLCKVWNFIRENQLPIALETTGLMPVPIIAAC